MSFLKRKTHKPQAVETIAEPEQGFAQIAFADIDTAIDNKLTAAEWRLWMYLTKIDRYGDKWRDLPAPIEIAVRLGMDRRTVEKAMFRLDELGLYSVRVQKWQGVNSSAARAHDTAQFMKQAKKSRESVKPALDKGGYLAQNAVNLPNERLNNPSTVNLPNERLNNPDRALELLPDNSSSAPHTIKTYSNFIQTLLESERENFEKFVREEWRRLKREEIVSLERFLAKPEDLKSWYERFLKSPVGKEAKKKAIASGRDWQNDPCFIEWIHEAFHRGYEWVHENEADREQRNAFYDWAFAVNAFEGVCL
ncbi:MAG: hypothetical protein H0U45_11300 [Tatlockia sp.]|nr:hypothetical protein [Tatlockia sp.]